MDANESDRSKRSSGSAKGFGFGEGVWGSAGRREHGVLAWNMACKNVRAMQVPLQLTFRGVESDPDIEGLTRRQAEALEDVCDHISSCRVAIEKPHAVSRSGRPQRVRIDLTVPPGHELVVDKNSSRGDPSETVSQTVREAFKTARRQLEALSAQQRNEVKSHPAQAAVAIVAELFEDHGFLRTAEGREIYFHANSVLNEDFEDVHVGDGVHFVEDMGEHGVHASTVRVVDGRGRADRTRK